jgi:hypothetical protein
MTNPTFKRWTADDIAKLKNMAQTSSGDGVSEKNDGKTTLEPLRRT